ncbi:MAG: sulfotransferase [Cyanobacteria bacterium P01_B01_bin.77]
MNLPNFLILGAAKAGTSSLHYYLSQHPQIFMPTLKEPKFFALEGEELNFQNPDQAINQDSINSLSDYQELFGGVTNEVAIGEASPIYLYSEKAAHRIRRYIPKTKLIVVLRNPVDRAFSCYTHLRREGYETLSFEDALQAEENRIKNNWAHLWHYQEAGFYSKQLKPYLNLFDREQIKIFLFDDLCKDSLSLLQEIYAFLGVDADFVPDLEKRNVSSMPKSLLLQKLLFRGNFLRDAFLSVFPRRLYRGFVKHIKKWNMGEKLSLAPCTRLHLQRIYRDDTLELQGLIQKDLSMWLK